MTLIKKNPIVLAFITVLILVSLFAAYRFISQEPHTLYARVKVSQGLWWANTAKPATWMVHAVKKGDVERNLSGKPIIEVLEVRSYPWWDAEQYDIYLVLKLETDYNERTEKYTFKRSNITAGSPIDMALSNADLTGTVMEISADPFEEEYVEKEIILTATKINEDISRTIKPEDTFNDGVDKVFRILEVEKKPSYLVYSSVGNNYPIEASQYEDITIRALIKVRKLNDIYVYREELPLSIGKSFNIVSSNTVLRDFIITDVL